MKEHLVLRPYDISDKTWVYEEPRGLSVIHEIWIDGKYQRTDEILIPKRKIKGYLDRLNRRKK